MAWNMEPLKEHIVTDHGDGIYEITSPPMRYKEYVIVGREKALLVDTGFGWDSLKSAVDKITDKPLIVINTHGHPDHCGGNAEFGQTYMNSEDLELFHYKASFEARANESGFWHIPGNTEHLQKDGSEPIHLLDGAEFDLGGRTLKVIYTPGHSAGSISLSDSLTRAIFCADTCLAFGAMLIEPCSTPLSIYKESLGKLANEKPTALYTGHMPGKIPPAQIDKMIALTDRVLAGEEGEPFKSPMGSGFKLSEAGAALSYTREIVR